MNEEIKENKENWNEENEYQAWEDELETEPPKKESLFKRILSGLGTGGLVVGGGLLFGLGSLISFIFTAVVGLGMVWLGIITIFNDSVIWGLVILLIGTPIAIGLSRWLFLFLFPIAILVGIVWGIIQLFGGDVSFWNIWDVIWLIVKVLILGFGAYLLISGFIEAKKTKTIKSYFKEFWFYIILFFLFLWLFFH